MGRARMFDRHGNELDDRIRICPPGGHITVPPQFMDARTVYPQAFGDGLLHRPGYVQAALGDAADALDPTGKVVMTPGEEARQRYIIALNESWKTENYARRLSRNTKPGLA